MQVMELAPLVKPLPEESITNATSDAPNFRSAAIESCNGDGKMPRPSRIRQTIIAGFWAILFLAAVIIGVLLSGPKNSTSHNNRDDDDDFVTTIAFCGNSMIYHNDCPRLVEIILVTLLQHHQQQEEGEMMSPTRLQDSCLRGGANFATLWKDGNGMFGRFGSEDIGAPTVQALLDNPPRHDGCWDFVLLQDQEQYSTANSTVSIQALREHYLPAIQKSCQNNNNQKPPKVLLLETFPYQSARLRETIGLGGMKAFTKALQEGYEAYTRICREEFGLNCRIIPMATAVWQLSQSDPELWSRLYDPADGVHPSPHATWLQACLIVAVATSQAPSPLTEAVQSAWEERARYWGHHNQRLPLPTQGEAETLRQLACRLVLPSKSCD